MTDRQRESWTLVQHQGFWRFFVVHGVLRFGLPFASIGLLWRYLDFFSRGGWAGFPGELFHFAFAAVVFGGGMSLWLWRSNMKRYNLRD